MPLTPKDEIEDAEVEQQSNQSDDEALEELRQRVDDLEERTEVPFGLDTLDELAESQAARDKVTEERVAELKSRVDQQEAVIHELVTVVEWLGAAFDPNNLEKGQVTVANEGSDAYPWNWDTETLDFKAERFE